MNIDQGKLAQIQEVMGWLKQAEKHYRWQQYEIADDCVKKARAALTNPIFDRQPIIGFARNQQPEVVKVKFDGPLGFAIIDAVNFDPEAHELYTELPPAGGKRTKSN